MKTVKVQRAALLLALLENRDKHEREYKEAHYGWLQLMRKAAMDLRDAISNEAAELREAVGTTEKARRTVATLAPPNSYLEHYDRAIKMAEMSVEETIELEQHEFDQLVMDNWQWSREFRATASSYTVGR